MKTPLVSIVTPVFNAEKFIQETVLSVKNQTFENFEHILVDDGSNDQSLAILEELAKDDPRVKVFSTGENQGAAKSRNLAIHEATGRYIAFIDSDDLWLPTKLEKQIIFMNENNAALTFTSYFKILEDGTKTNRTVNAVDIVTYDDLLSSCVIGCLTAMYDTEQLGKVFMPDIARRQDYATWLKILRPGGQARGLKEPLAYYRLRHDSISANKIKAAIYQWKVYREIEGLSLIKSWVYFLFYSFQGFKKYMI